MINQQSPEKILLESLKNNLPIFSWYLFNDNVIKAELKLKSVRIEKSTLVFQVLPESKNYVEQMISGIGKMNFMIPEYSFLFSSELKKMSDDGELTVGLPEKNMFFERRRDQERISPDIPIRVRVISEKNEKIQICNDLSLGGLSLIFSKSDKSKLTESSDEEVMLELTYGGKSFNLKAHVAKVLSLKPYMLESHPYAGERVSFKFIDLSNENKLEIQKIIEGHKKFLDDLLGR